MLEEREVAVKVHQPCPDCGSSDAMSIYSDHNYCFSCGTHTWTKDKSNVEQAEKVVEDFLPHDGHWSALPKRRLAQHTCQKYDVRFAAASGLLCFVYHDEAGKPVAMKARTVDKQFRTSGAWQKTTPLFGMDLFPSKGKYVTITEGEIDAMSVYQLTGSKWPCVSVKNGATGALADCKAAYDWLDGFDNIVVAFDSDEPGQKAARAVAGLFMGKSKIVKMRDGLKDANDYLMAQREADFVDDWWKAETQFPDGLINMASMKEALKTRPAKAPVMYPWEGLNRLTYGIRPAELVVLSAGSGLGKSAVVRELAYYILQHSKERIGMLMLEESKEKTGLGLMSIAANKPLHLPDTVVEDAEFEDAWLKTGETGRVVMFDHFGSLETDNVMAKIKGMIRALDCKYVFLDHISIIFSAQSNGDERKAIDEIMTKMRMLVQQTGVSLIAVSHLKRPDGKGHEEGAATSLNQLRGSGAIAQLSDIVIGLERNGQHEDPIARNTTKVRVLKNRFAGVTGPACQLFYNHETGRLSEVGEDL